MMSTYHDKINLLPSNSSSYTMALNARVLLSVYSKKMKTCSEKITYAWSALVCEFPQKVLQFWFASVYTGFNAEGVAWRK